MTQQTTAQFIRQIAREHIERQGKEYLEGLEAIARASLALAQNPETEALPGGKELKNQLQAFLRLKGVNKEILIGASSGQGQVE